MLKKIMVCVLTCVMMLSLVGVMREAVWAEESEGQVKTLESSLLADVAKNTLSDGQEIVAGDFTILGCSGMTIEGNNKKFEDGYVGTKRLTLGGNMSTARACIKFETDAAATVKIWWVCGGNGRQIQILDVDGTQVAVTEEAAVKNALYISELEIDEAGTYFLGGFSGSNYVYKLVVEQKVGVQNPPVNDVTETQDAVDEGDDTGLKIYDMEGFADAFGVTGGGLLPGTNDNYYKVVTAEEFLSALLKAKNERKNTVIELAADINLGCKEVENYANYSKIIKAHSAQPLTHPTLIETGVSQLSLDGFSNLTIFSSNGASIKHTTITMKRSQNIMIRNIKFDELWEWDEATKGDYDRNDWDYITIDSGCNGIWIDHCTFYKAYDGVVDMKNPNPVTNVTVSWCEFLPGSEGNVFFDVMMDDIFENPDKYPTYKYMLDEGMTKEQIYKYAYAQKKTHLLGQSDKSTNAEGLKVTFANNYYKNPMDRLPRLRYGISHVYNCVMDAQEMLDLKLSIKNTSIASKIVSNGAASTCGGQVLLENCFINGIQKPLNSGNGSSPAGYINAINSVYYINGIKKTLAPQNNTSADDLVLITAADAFIASLPYEDYVLYDAEDLRGIIPYYAGAGKLELTALQWEKTSYNEEWKDPVINENPENSEGQENTENTEEPEEPENTENSESPEEPENTENSGNAEDSENTENPEEPENTENPGNPEEPENTENPGNEEESENTENSGNPEESENTENPEDLENPTKGGMIATVICIITILGAAFAAVLLLVKLHKKS